MLLKKIEQQVLEQQQDGWIYPQYGGYCISNIADAVRYIFGIGKAGPFSPILDAAGIVPSNRQKIVALLLDAFGWNQWLRYSDRFEFLKRISGHGALAPITSVFPSTTPVALTSIRSGLTPRQHGLPAGQVYYEELGQIISPLRFRPLNGDRQDQLLESGVDPRILFDGTTSYDTLGKAGIPSFSLTHEVLKSGVFGSVTTHGSTEVPFFKADGLAKALFSKLTEVAPPAYFSAYFGIIDVVAHSHGVHSEQYLAELELLFTSLQNEFIAKLPRDVAEETVLLVFADHGHIGIEPQETVYLNRYPLLVENLRTGPDGEIIPPWGELPRTVFLAIEDGKLEETSDFLTKELKGTARVFKTAEAIEDGLFGVGNPHPRFERRVGDILLVPERNKTLWYELPGREMPLVKSTHGGLSPEEMLVPFAAAKISDLQ